MATITLKDIPEALLVRIQTAALRERRSLDQEAVARETAEERSQRQMAAWRELAGGWASDVSFEHEVAAVYADRTSGRDCEL